LPFARQEQLVWIGECSQSVEEIEQNIKRDEEREKERDQSRNKKGREIRQVTSNE
jgi:hypothetical protein